MKKKNKGGRPRNAVAEARGLPLPPENPQYVANVLRAVDALRDGWEPAMVSARYGGVVYGRASRIVTGEETAPEEPHGQRRVDLAEQAGACARCAGSLNSAKADAVYCCLICTPCDRTPGRNELFCGQKCLNDHIAAEHRGPAGAVGSVA